MRAEESKRTGLIWVFVASFYFRKREGAGRERRGREKKRKREGER